MGNVRKGKGGIDVLNFCYILNVREIYKKKHVLGSLLVSVIFYGHYLLTIVYVLFCREYMAETSHHLYITNEQIIIREGGGIFTVMDIPNVVQ